MPVPSTLTSLWNMTSCMGSYRTLHPLNTSNTFNLSTTGKCKTVHHITWIHAIRCSFSFSLSFSFSFNVSSSPSYVLFPRTDLSVGVLADSLRDWGSVNKQANAIVFRAWTCGGPVVLWSCGPGVLWRLWSCGPVVRWSCGPVVLWSRGPGGPVVLALASLPTYLPTTVWGLALGLSFVADYPTPFVTCTDIIQNAHTSPIHI
jgi:hypothetical protein